ncbi:MAG TPA: 5'-3' exonuclease H3TH domain-containing protein [Verrucomicrobiae bacterium]|jgi:DNA polymerase-1
MKPRLLIVDGHAYAYRAFHAIRHLRSPAGVPTNAIYGFIKMLAKMRESLQPTHQLIVWDGGLAAERMELLPEYKQQRPPMPESLDQQITALTHYLQAAGLASFCQDGVEADDWIAAVTRQAVASDADVIIASSDKDFMQLVSPRVGLFNAGDKTAKVWTASDVRAKTGVEPAQIVDWLSLIGDTVDNIAGVPGVGPKTAADLLGQFGSVDLLYARLGEVKSDRVRANLAASVEAVRRNQRLIRLNDALAGASALGDCAPRAADVARLQMLFAEWGFRGLLAQLTEAQQKELL